MLQHRAFEQCRIAETRTGEDHTLGARAEDLAHRHLERSGLRVVGRNFRTADYRGEVDLVARDGGTLVFVGIPLTERVSFPSGRIRRKEIKIQNVRRQNRCLEHALELVNAGKIDPNFLATHTFEVANAQKAFETAAFHLDGALKVSIVFG